MQYLSHECYDQSRNRSFFTTHPEIQAQYFVSLYSDEQLEKHGVRMLNAVGAVVKHCKSGDDGKRGEKVDEVTKPTLGI